MSNKSVFEHLKMNPRKSGHTLRLTKGTQSQYFLIFKKTWCSLSFQELHKDFLTLQIIYQFDDSSAVIGWYECLDVLD